MKPLKGKKSPTAKGDAAGKASCFAWDGETLVLNVLGQPSAKQDAIGNVKGHQLNVSVTEAAREGRATDHMLRFLAGEFGVTAATIEVVFGRFNVNKQLRILAPKKLPRVLALLQER